MATQSVATRTVRPWVWTTPLGTPVVPEVNRMSDGSSEVDGGGSPFDLGPGGVGGAGHEAIPRLGPVRRRSPGHHDGGQIGKVDAGFAQHGHVVDARGRR